ncbi:MAG: hypothetical protein J7K77_01210 [Dehalococcoidales bacterium]|nr:hypothetical protein [Dehalococcoidales bacterium]
MSVNGRRSHIEIIGDILKLGRTGKTDIMYSCDLSYYQLQKYLRFLVEGSFLKMDSGGNGRKFYQPTVAGERLLRYINKVRVLLGLADRDADTTAEIDANSALSEESQNYSTLSKVSGRV